MVTLVTSRHISVSPITAHTLLRSFPDFVSLFLSYLLFALPSFFFFLPSSMLFLLFCPCWEMTGISHQTERVIWTSSSSLPALIISTLVLQTPHYFSSLPFLTLCTGFFGIPLECVSQGKAVLSWDSHNYLPLSCMHSFWGFFFSLSLSLLWGSLWSMQDTLIQSAVEKGPNFAPLANELSPCWAAFRPAGCCYCGHRLVHIGWWEEPEQRSESEKRCSAAKAWALLCLPVRTTTAYAGTAAGTSFSLPLPPSILLLSNTTWLASPSLSACPGALTEYFCSRITSRSAVLSSRVFHFFSVLNSHLTLLPKCTGIHGSRITWVTSSSAAKVSAVT